jgi:hypothetical protein
MIHSTIWSGSNCFDRSEAIASGIARSGRGAVRLGNDAGVSKDVRCKVLTQGGNRRPYSWFKVLRTQECQSCFGDKCGGGVVRVFPTFEDKAHRLTVQILTD